MSAGVAGGGRGRVTTTPLVRLDERGFVVGHEVCLQVCVGSTFLPIVQRSREYNKCNEFLLCRQTCSFFKKNRQ